MKTKQNFKNLLTPRQGADWKGLRSVLTEEYHYCSRCGSRRPISELEWQRGLLLCKRYNCIDAHPLIGEREAAVAHAIEVPTNELMPNEKLVTPTAGDDNTGDEIIF